jgi:hypothetical protein
MTTDLLRKALVAGAALAALSVAACNKPTPPADSAAAPADSSPASAPSTAADAAMAPASAPAS